MLTPPQSNLAGVVERLTEAGKRLICAFDGNWQYPGDVGVSSGQLSHRDPDLLERLCEASGNPYRLTPLGQKARALILSAQPRTRGE